MVRTRKKNIKKKKKPRRPSSRMTGTIGAERERQAILLPSRHPKEDNQREKSGHFKGVRKERISPRASLRKMEKTPRPY